MKLTKLVMSFLTMLLSIGVMNAQVTTSAMSGSVKTSDGKPAVGVRVKAIHEPTGTQYSVVTRKGGRFDIANMNTGGPYTVTFSGGDAKDIVKTDIYLTLGETESVDATYQTEEIRVVGTRTTQKLKTGASTSFGNRIINSVPNISRSITNITSLTPQAGGGNSFGGRDGRYNNFQIDGASLNNNFGLSNSPLPGGAVSPISIDAVEEISVNVSPFDVRQANFTGAGINATTKRGTNVLKGSVYTFYRDQELLGNKAVGQKIPPVTQSKSQTFGALIGGPIIKNKLFFFASAEKVDISIPGVFWKATRPGQVADVNTSRVRASALDSVSSYLKSKYGYETGNSENLGNFETNNIKFLGRLDWVINKQHSVALRYNYSKTDDDQLLNGNSAPNPRSGTNRWSNNSMSYENSNYKNTNLLNSYSLEVKSNFNSRLSNQFIATYTQANDPKRSTNSSLFPFIDIWEGGNNYISAGYELFSFNNDVQNNTLTFNNNVTYNIGKHNLTAGLAYEKIYVKNNFLRYGTSYYRYNSLQDFFDNATPSSFAITFPVAGRKEFVEVDFGQASVYAQDEIKVNDKFRLTLGLRADKALFQNELIPNSSIAALTFNNLKGQPINFDVSKWPKERVYISPRLGFTYDPNGNKSLIIRGGAGIFTGRFPFVWFTNQPSNSGTSVVPYEVSGSRLSGFRFNPNPNAYRDSFSSTAGAPPLPSSLAIADPNFKMPQVLRISAAADKKLGNDWTLSFEAIYNKDINALLQYNANQRAPIGTTFGAGGRPLFGNSTATRRINSSISEAMVLTNSKKGAAGIFTLQLAKKFSNNWDFSLAYTHTEAVDLSGNPGSQAASSWSNVPSVRGNNNLDMANNDFATPNRVIAWANYQIKINKFLKTNISLVYTGFEQGRFNYRYTNDFNQDGISSDLIYVPKDASEITFVQSGAFTPAQQADAFFKYIEQDKYLSKSKGNFATRNGAKLPWLSNLDIRVLQDILPLGKANTRGIQLSFEVENFTNMLNSDWGVSKTLNYNNGAILRFVAAPTATTPATFNLNTVNGAFPTRTFASSITAGNVWRLNLGLRLLF